MPLNTDENTPTIRKCQHGDVAPRMHVTPAETYETPMKAARKNIEPLENFQKQQAQKLDSIVIMPAREVSQARVYEEQQPWKNKAFSTNEQKVPGEGGAKGRLQIRRPEIWHGLPLPYPSR